MLALAGGEWSALRLDLFTAGEITPCTHPVGDWVSPRTTPDDVENRKLLSLLGLELSPLGSPTRSQSLYLLRYLGFLPFSYRAANYFARPINSLGVHTYRRIWFEGVRE
jgi:hypothetical protein